MKPDLSTEFAGIRSPNPFWLASAPPTDRAVNVQRAFKAGWGGVVWKTLGIDPPVVNVNGPRYGFWQGDNRRVQGFSNIELISDRPIRINLREIAEIKAPVASMRGSHSAHTDASSGNITDTTTARSGHCALISAISLRLIRMGRSLISSMLLKPCTRRLSPCQKP